MSNHNENAFAVGNVVKAGTSAGTTSAVSPTR